MIKKIAITFDIEPVMVGKNDHSLQSSKQMYCNLEREVNYILKFCDEAGIKATFFIVGKLAKESPSIVKSISLEGHEVASHSMSHSFFSQLDEYEIEKEIYYSKSLLEDVAGVEVLGFRAPAWTVNEENRIHFYDSLKKHGYKYSSSVYPGKTPLYGMPKANPDLHMTTSGIMEFPMPTKKALGIRVGFSGGLYFRVLPNFMINRFINKYVDEQRPWFMYFHPYEFDVVKYGHIGSIFERLLLMYNRKNLSKRIQHVITAHSDMIGTMQNIIDNELLRCCGNNEVSNQKGR